MLFTYLSDNKLNSKLEKMSVPFPMFNNTGRLYFLDFLILITVMRHRWQWLFYFIFSLIMVRSLYLLLYLSIYLTETPTKKIDLVSWYCCRRSLSYTHPCYLPSNSPLNSILKYKVIYKTQNPTKENKVQYIVTLNWQNTWTAKTVT